LSLRIYIPDWIIQAIGKHIIAQDALSSRNKNIGIDESTQFGIVITGLEIVEPGFSVLGLPAMHAYADSIPTRNLRFRVGTLVAERFNVLEMATVVFQNVFP
jgi:hypothetical protein